MEQTGDRLTFVFDSSALCPGTVPGGGHSSFFIGLASAFAPQKVVAQLRDTATAHSFHSLDARAPAFP